MQFLQACLAEVYHTPRVRELLLDHDSRLLQEFVPKLVILRAMFHLNQVIEAKRRALETDGIELKGLFHQVRDKHIDFGRLSAKDNRFDLSLSKSCLTTDEVGTGPQSKTNQKHLRLGGSGVLTHSERLNRALQDESQNSPTRTELQIKGRRVEILSSEGILVYKEIFRRARQPHLEVLFCDRDQSDTKLFGYMFILQNLLSPAHFERFVRTARRIAFENQQVLRDVQDFLIVESLRSVGSEYFVNKQRASAKMEFFTDQKRREHKLALKTLRPPLVWNQQSKESRNRLFSVQPFQDFPNLAFLEKDLADLGRELLVHNPRDWENFQTELIRFFRHQQLGQVETTQE